MKIHKLILILTLMISTPGIAQNRPSKSELIRIIEKANDYWQSTHTAPENSFWDNAAYHTGNMEVYFVTLNEKYRAYSEKWAVQNDWKGANATDKSKW